VKQLSAIHPPALQKRRRTIHITQNHIFADPEAFGDIFGNDIGLNNLKAKPRRHPGRHVQSKRSDFSISLVIAMTVMVRSRKLFV
jgi:hypothetical protein